MISGIALTNFKCFEAARISLSRLTVLAGVNAAGKSTVLQALTLLHQTLAANEQARHLALNGSCLNLGTVLETAGQVKPMDEMRFGFSYEVGEQSGECEWSFVATDRQSSSLPISRVDWQPSTG